jgi:hypothetical protein
MGIPVGWVDGGLQGGCLVVARWLFKHGLCKPMPKMALFLISDGTRSAFHKKAASGIGGRL